MQTVTPAPQSPSTGSRRIPSAIRRRDPHLRRPTPRPLAIAESAALSGRGRRRERNEDRVLEAAPLFAVADGMGGGLGGGVAADQAIAAVAEATPAPSDPAAGLAAAVENANARVRETAQERGWTHCGATLTAALLDAEVVTIAHVGDSRAYLLRNGRLRPLTDDHSMIAELVRSGGLTAEEAAASPMRGVLTRSIGGDATVDPDIRRIAAEPGDVLLLCSDGLSDAVSGPELVAILADAPNLAAAAAALLAAGYRSGGDDISVVLARVA